MRWTRYSSSAPLLPELPHTSAHFTPATLCVKAAASSIHPSPSPSPSVRCVMSTCPQLLQLTRRCRRWRSIAKDFQKKCYIYFIKLYYLLYICVYLDAKQGDANLDTLSTFSRVTTADDHAPGCWHHLGHRRGWRSSGLIYCEIMEE